VVRKVITHNIFSYNWVQDGIDIRRMDREAREIAIEEQFNESNLLGDSSSVAGSVISGRSSSSKSTLLPSITKPGSISYSGGSVDGSVKSKDSESEFYKN